MYSDFKKNSIRLLVLAEICALSIGMRGCNKKENTKDEKPNISAHNMIDELDINDEESVMNYATKIQMILMDQGEFVEKYDVVHALKLANINILDDTKIMNDKNELQSAIKTLGKITKHIMIFDINKHTSAIDKYITEEEFNDMLIAQSSFSDLPVDNDSLISTFYKRDFDKGHGYNKYTFMQDLVKVIKNEDGKFSMRGQIEAARLFVDLVNRRINSLNWKEDQVSYIMLSMFIENEPLIRELLKDEISNNRYYTYNLVPYGYPVSITSASNVLDNYGTEKSYIFDDSDFFIYDVINEKTMVLVK